MKLGMASVVALMSGMQPAVAREPTPPVPNSNPGSWLKEDDYPSAERAKGISGTSGFKLLVGNDGSVKDCHIESSSGSAALDATACALLKVRASFQPGRDGNGKKIESIYSGRLTWRLPTSVATSVPEPQTLTITVDISKDGVVEKCMSDKSADFSLPADPCMRYPVGMKGRSYIGADGLPIPVRLVNRTSMAIEPR